MARTKKSVVKKNKSVNVIVQVNSHNKRKTAPKAKTPNHRTIFVNPASNNGFHDNGLTQQLLHHLILRNKE